MARNTLLETSFALVARPLPDTQLIADPRLFAWEILRRRADYRPAPATVEQIGTAGAPIELIRPQGHPTPWGLRFR